MWERYFFRRRKYFPTKNIFSGILQYMIRVGVIRGGSNAAGYQKSISDGSIILRALREHDDYTPYDILIDQNEVLHLDGVPTVPNNLAHSIDICISTITYPLIKNGPIEKILKSFGIPCVSTPAEALRGYIPDSLRQQISSVGIRMPRQMPIDFGDEMLAQKIHNTFSPPYSLIISNEVGEVSHISHASNIQDLFNVLKNQTLSQQHTYMIEEYTPGDEWAVTILPNFRETKWYSLHPVYRGNVPLAFRSNVPPSLSAQGLFATPKVRESLDLYTKLAAGSLSPQVPTTFIFRHVENRKPTLLRIIHRHTLGDDPEVLQALKESVVSEGEYLDVILKRYRS